MPPGPAGPPQAAAGHPQRRRPHPVAVRRPGPPEKGREDRQAAVRRLLHHQPGLRRPVRVRQVYDRQEPHRRRGQTLCPERDAAHERLLQGVEAGREHRLFPLRHPAGVHHLQVCHLPAKALWHHPRHHRQELYHQQLPRPCVGADRRFHQAQVRKRVPGAFARRRHQLS